MKIGDKVRFLSEVGGGVVTGFQGKDMVLVEDADGFDIPMPIKECVVIDTDDYNMKRKPVAPAPKQEVAGAKAKGASVKVRPDEEEDERPVTYRPAERKGGDRLSAFLLGNEQYLVVRDDVVEFVFVITALVGFVFRKVVFGIDLCPEGIEFRDLRDGEPPDIHAVVQLVGNGDGFSDIGAGVGYFGDQVDVLLRRGGRVGHLPDALLAFDGFSHFDGNALGLVFLAFGFDHRRFDVQSAFAFGLHQVGDGGLLFGAPFAIDIARYHAPHELRTAQHDEILESRTRELILIQRQRSGDFDHQVFVHGHFLFGNGDRNGLLAILPLCRESHPQGHDGQQGKDPSTGGGGKVQRWEKCFVDIHSGMWKMCKDDRLPVFGRMNDGSFGLVPL